MAAKYFIAVLDGRPGFASPLSFSAGKILFRLPKALTLLQKHEWIIFPSSDEEFLLIALYRFVGSENSRELATKSCKLVLWEI